MQLSPNGSKFTSGMIFFSSLTLQFLTLPGQGSDWTGSLSRPIFSSSPSSPSSGVEGEECVSGTPRSVDVGLGFFCVFRARRETAPVSCGKGTRRLRLVDSILVEDVRDVGWVMYKFHVNRAVWVNA